MFFPIFAKLNLIETNKTISINITDYETQTKHSAWAAVATTGGALRVAAATECSGRQSAFTAVSLSGYAQWFQHGPYFSAYL